VLFRSEKLTLTQAHPDLEETAKAASAAGVARGDTVSEFWQVVNNQRDVLGKAIEEQNRLIMAGEISGNDYRKAISAFEADMSRAPQVMKDSDPRWANVPLTAAEKAAYYKGQPRPPIDEVDSFIEAWYNATRASIKPGPGKEMDFDKLMTLRGNLRKAYSKEVVTQGMEVINQYKLPAYAKAQELMNQYQEIPKYRGWTKAQAYLADTAIQQMRDMVASGMSTSRAKLAYMKRDPKGYALAKRANARRNPARKAFWTKHGLLSVFYSDLAGPGLEAAKLDVFAEMEEEMAPELEPMP
jgi:uncharacterized protein YciI